MPVQRKGRARRVFEKSCIGFRRTFRSQVKQEFGEVAKSSHFPFHVGGVLELGRVMRATRTHVASPVFAANRAFERVGSAKAMPPPSNNLSVDTPVTQNASWPSRSRTGRSSAAPSACGGTAKFH